MDVVKSFVLTKTVLQTSSIGRKVSLLHSSEKLSKKEAFLLAVQIAKSTSNLEGKICSPSEVPNTIQASDLEILEASSESLITRVTEVFSSPLSLCFSFLKEPENYLTTSHCNIDFDAVNALYAKLKSIEEDDMYCVYDKTFEDFYDQISQND
jgi:hypothetical protein